MAAFEPEVLDVGRAHLADPQPVQAEQHGQRGVDTVVLLGGEQDTPSSERSRPRASEGWTRGRRTYWAVRRDSSVDASEAVEAAHRGEPPVDRRCSQPALLHRAAPQLDVRSGCFQHGKANLGGSLEEAAEIVAVGIERSAAVASQEGGRGELCLIARISGSGSWIDVAADSMVVMAVPPVRGRSSQAPTDSPAFPAAARPQFAKRVAVAG